MASKAGNQDIARRYATAFFELAQEQSQVDQVAKDLQSVQLILEDSGFASFIGNTTLRRSVQAEAMVAISKQLKFAPLTEKFLGTLAEKRRLQELGEIVAALQNLISGYRGEITARVTAAQALDQAQIGEIAASLKAALGKNVQVNLDIDPSIMGGLVIRVGSRIIDSSVRTKLERLHRALKKTDDLSDKAKMKEVA
ncbi:MAG: F0F1 ATP synthase subunit delta [Alphaproteobacteria bacterium]